MGSNHCLSASHSSGCGFVDVTCLEWWFSNITDVIQGALGFALFSVLTLIEYILFKSKMVKPLIKRSHTQASFSRRAGSGAGGEAAPFQEAGCCGPGVHQVRCWALGRAEVGTYISHSWSQPGLRGEQTAGWSRRLTGVNTGPEGQGFREPGGGERRACVVTSWLVCELNFTQTHTFLFLARKPLLTLPVLRTVSLIRPSSLPSAWHTGLWQVCEGMTDNLPLKSEPRPTVSKECWDYGGRTIRLDLSSRSH